MSILMLWSIRTSSDGFPENGGSSSTHVGFKAINNGPTSPTPRRSVNKVRCQTDKDKLGLAQYKARTATETKTIPHHKGIGMRGSMLHVPKVVKFKGVIGSICKSLYLRWMSKHCK
jgi:hypothetical protein